MEKPLALKYPHFATTAIKPGSGKNYQQMLNQEEKFPLVAEDRHSFKMPQMAHQQQGKN